MTILIDAEAVSLVETNEVLYSGVFQKLMKNKYLRHKIINVSLSAAVLAKKVIFNGRKGVLLSLLFVFPCFSVQFRSVTQSCLTHCNPMDCSMPGFPVHHQLPELAQTHVL